MIYSAIFKIQ